MVCWKLVRDRVGLELAASGSGVRVWRSGLGDLEGLLRVKVVEEALEFAASGSLEEAADLVEALVEWLRVRGLGWEDLVAVRRRKKALRGGFSGGFVAVWEGVDSC